MGCFIPGAQCNTCHEKLANGCFELDGDGNAKGRCAPKGRNNYHARGACNGADHGTWQGERIFLGDEDLALKVDVRAVTGYKPDENFLYYGTAHTGKYFIRYEDNAYMFAAGEHPKFWRCAKCDREIKKTHNLLVKGTTRYVIGSPHSNCAPKKLLNGAPNGNSTDPRPDTWKKFQAGQHPHFKKKKHSSFQRRRLTGIEKRFQQQGLLQ